MTDPMTDPTHPDALEDGALVAAWLVGDLEGDDAAAVERRLAREPELAARADRVARTLVALRRPDEVAAPDGAAARLRTRLDREQADTGGGGGATVADLGTARRRRGWGGGLGAAAAVVVVLVGVGSVVRLAGGGGEEAAEDTAMVAEDAAQGPAPTAAEESAGEESQVDGEEAAPDAGAAAVPGGAEEEMASEAEQPAAASGTDAAGPPPVVLDQGVALGTGEATDGAADGPVRVPDGSEAAAAGGQVLAEAPEAVEAEVRDRYAALPEAEALVGTPREQAGALALAATDAVRAAAPFAAGVRPDACIDEVLSAASRGEGGAPVIARVEQVTLDGAPALVHVLVTGDAGGDALAGVRVVVTDAATCAPLVDVAP